MKYDVIVTFEIEAEDSQEAWSKGWEIVDLLREIAKENPQLGFNGTVGDIESPQPTITD